MEISVNWKSKTFKESPKLGNSRTNQVRNQLAINPCGSTISVTLKIDKNHNISLDTFYSEIKLINFSFSSELEALIFPNSEL